MAPRSPCQGAAERVSGAPQQGFPDRQPGARQGCWSAGKLRKARTTTVRALLINIPARVAFSALTDTLRLPASPAATPRS